MMLGAVTAIISVIIALFTAFWAVFIFWAPPRFTRKRMSYELELSTSLIHESAQSNSYLTVRYGKRYGKKLLHHPYIVRIRLSNTGRKDVRSSDFDQATPMQLDLGVKIVALLKVSCSPDDMPDPRWSLTETRLNIGPSMFPRHAVAYFVLLVDGPCTALAHKNPLTGVALEQAMKEERKYGISLSHILTYAMIAFVIWWVIQEPVAAARLVHGIGASLSWLAHGLSNFIASI
jgi:hypothetical protein